MNHYFLCRSGLHEICVTEHFPTELEFYPQKFGERHFLLETNLKLMAFMRPYTIPVNLNRSTEYERWASRVNGTPIMQGSEEKTDYESTLLFEDTPSLIAINKKVEQPLTEHSATLDVQVSETEMLRLHVDNDLLE